MPTYYYLNRPPGIGCQPGGFDPDTRETYLPGRYVKGRHVLGKVEYPKRLPAEEVHRYDLFPADVRERAELVLARETCQAIKDEYLQTDNDRLVEFKDNDVLAWAVLVLRNHPSVAE